MKRSKTRRQIESKGSALELKDGALAEEIEEAPMVRTQIYLDKGEHEFLRREAARGERTMASVIRSYIDEKMEISEEAWTNNPMLRPTPRDGAGESREDAGINLDHYLYGCPKDWIKVNGKFAEAPPLPEDYYSNPARQKAYDKMIEKLDESQ